MRYESLPSKVELNKKIIQFAIENYWIVQFADEYGFKNNLLTEPCIITQKGLDFALSLEYKCRGIILHNKLGETYKIVL